MKKIFISVLLVIGLMNSTLANNDCSNLTLEELDKAPEGLCFTELFFLKIAVQDVLEKVTEHRDFKLELLRTTLNENEGTHYLFYSMKLKYKGKDRDWVVRVERAFNGSFHKHVKNITLGVIWKE